MFWLSLLGFLACFNPFFLAAVPLVSYLLKDSSNYYTRKEIPKIFNARRSLSAASATNSVVSGSGIQNIATGLTGQITVTAKDSSGNTITTGGELFMIRISNTCTLANSHYCSPSGTTTPLSSFISDMMTDNTTISIQLK